MFEALDRFIILFYVALLTFFVIIPIGIISIVILIIKHFFK